MTDSTPSRRRFLQTLPPALAATGFTSAGAPWLLGTEPHTSVQATAAESTTVARSQKGVVATVHPIASQAAIETFEQGGNAIDAAVAASLMLSVVDGFNSGIGGGCLAIVRTAQGKVAAMDGREMAPQAARPEMFYRDGKPDPQLSQIGPLAAGVPGLLATLERLAKQHGAIDWNAALNRAAEVADAGFELDENYVSRLRSVAARLRRFPSSAQILLDEHSNPWPVGHRLVQKDLARTLRQVSQQGSRWFYEGEFADRISKFMADAGGMITRDDMARYTPKEREPIVTQYRGSRVFGFPPPSSGGIHNAQMLGMLEAYPVQELFTEEEAIGRHLLIEVMKRAMADRAYWLGDADFARVPRGLLDRDYLADRAASIRLDQATAVAQHGQPPRADVDLFGNGGHTTHLTTADREGNVVALTQTVNTTFGNKMIVPGTGVVLNNELDDFSIAPGVRNAFGLLGSEANLIAPGKRPLSSMSPTLVLDDNGQPKLACGAAGGPKIITTVLQILVRTLDLGQSIDEAIAAPRIHHQWSPDQAVCEYAVDAGVIEKLKSMQHSIKRTPTAAVAQGLQIESNGSELIAASDPRVPSRALGI